jgi:hypothetical protein
LKTLLPLFVTAAFLGFVPDHPADAELRFQRNGTDVVGIFGLYSDTTCALRPLRGKVVQRRFKEDATTIEGFVVELPDGTRDYVNVGIPEEGPFNTNLAIYGLQRLIREGRTVQGRVLWCGAAGRVGTLEAIW